jgi:hypothetical protein
MNATRTSGPAILELLRSTLDLNEWEETAVLIHLLTDPMAVQPPSLGWMMSRLSYLKRTYPYVGQSIFRSAPAWWKDL